MFGLRQELDKHRRGEVGRKAACPSRAGRPEGQQGNDCRGESIQPLHSQLVPAYVIDSGVRSDEQLKNC